DFSRLVFHENKTVSDKNAVVKLARSNPQGFEKIFTAPGNPTQWIIQQAKREHGVEIEKQAAEALKSVINGDLLVADSELAKLAAYVNYERPITEADVALMTTGYVAQADIFEMVDAIGVQDGKTAMQLMQKLLKEGSDPLSMLAMIARQFRLLILAKEYIEETGSASGLDKAIGIHPFVAKKMGQQAHRFESLRNIEDIYRKLADMDFRIKTGKIEQVTALELFIASVTN
ncbi:MAG TPA: DNA polymerase III subunit delta, partial [Aggregatilineales bacterium]|nr:DNA polymerase III subunit delta [Aggregatilineales bacterium]